MKPLTLLGVSILLTVHLSAQDLEANQEKAPSFGQALLVSASPSQALKMEIKYGLIHINGLKTGLACEKHLPLCHRVADDLYLLEMREVSNRYTLLWDEQSQTARPFDGASSPVGDACRVITGFTRNRKEIGVYGVDPRSRRLTPLWMTPRESCHGISPLGKYGERLHFIIHRDKKRFVLSVTPGQPPREVPLKSVELGAYRIAHSSNGVMRDQLLLCKHQKPTGTPKTSVDPLTHDVAYLDLNTQKIHPIGQAEGYWRTIFGEGAVLPISWTQGDTPPELDEHLPQVSVHYVHAKTHQILTRPGKRK